MFLLKISRLLVQILHRAETVGNNTHKTHVKQWKTAYAESFHGFPLKVGGLRFHVLLDNKVSEDPFVAVRLKAAQIQGCTEDTEVFQIITRHTLSRQFIR